MAWLTKRTRSCEEFAGLCYELVDLCLTLVPHCDGDIYDVTHVAEGCERGVQEQGEQVTFLMLVWNSNKKQ